MVCYPHADADLAELAFASSNANANYIEGRVRCFVRAARALAAMEVMMTKQAGNAFIYNTMTET